MRRRVPRDSAAIRTSAVRHTKRNAMERSRQRHRTDSPSAPTGARAAKRRCTGVPLVLAAAVLGVSPAFAAPPEVRLLPPGEPVDPALVERILGGAPKGRTPGHRSIVKVDAASSPGEAAPARLALQVPFDSGSARLAPEAAAQLDALANALMQLEGPVRVAIDGHTDALGSDPYNDALSARRAMAVREYLMSRSVPGDWLHARGHGKRRPLDPLRPEAAENRRVEFGRLP
ncbi:MAG: OmpA family protein [Rubrivivax sp.]|nr:OmpA family protein [Rubrivivax sp.]